jgi:hypothetical protein
MVSILIGHNNLCAFCNDADANGPETFGRLLEKSVDVLYEQVPRVFVNLLSPVDVTALYPASEGPHPPPRRTRYLAPSTYHLRITPMCAALLSWLTGWCSLLHFFECSCGVNSDPAVREAVSKVRLLAMQLQLSVSVSVSVTSATDL